MATYRIVEDVVIGGVCDTPIRIYQIQRLQPVRSGWWWRRRTTDEWVTLETTTALVFAENTLADYLRMERGPVVHKEVTR